jgi:Hint domain
VDDAIDCRLFAGPADGVLVPVEHLVNGVSIVQCEAVEWVAYFHVELDSHDVIVTGGPAAGALPVMVLNFDSEAHPRRDWFG